MTVEGQRFKGEPQPSCSMPQVKPAWPRGKDL